MAAETIIESFCERCGTRYTFEPVRKRESKLVGLGKSLGILLDDHAASTATRDPFHGTFHFCLECRQYTCPSCWNEEAGFCLGCVPAPAVMGMDALDAAEAEATSEAASFMDQAFAEHAALDTPGAWPDADLHRDLPEPVRTAELEPMRASAALAALAWDTEVDAAPEPEAVAEADATPPIDGEWELGPEVLAARDVDAEPEPVEAEPVEADAEPEPEPLVVADTEADVDVRYDAMVEPGPMVPAVDVDAEPSPIFLGDAATDMEPDEVEVEAVAGSVDAQAAADLEPEPVVLAGQADDLPESVAEAEPELAAPETLAVAAAEVEPEPGAVASEVDAEASSVAVAVAVADAVDVALPVAAEAVDDQEADWAALLGSVPAEGDDPDAIVDDWSAMAPALGPDVAPLPHVTRPPRPVAPPVAPPAPAPIVSPPSAPAWQLTAPAPDADATPAAWPPLGPVFRPGPTPAPAVPHASVLAPRPVAGAAAANGRAQAGGLAQLPKGVRPCVSCELPLSASARFCRRCGKPQA